MKKSEIKTVNDLISLKESFNKILDKKIEKQKLSEMVSEISNMNFGEIKALFEGVSYRLFDNDKKCIADYVKTIKENKDLKTLYVLYENVIKPSFTNDPNLFVTSMLSISDNLDRKSLKEGLSKLRGVVKESVLKSGVKTDEIKEILSENKDINKSLSFILTEKKTPKNLFEHTNNLHTVVEYINENMKNSHETVLEGREKLISDLNESINCANDWETSVIKDLTLCFLSNSNSENLFEQYKNDCLSLLEEKIEDSDRVEEKARFSAMKQSLCEKEYKEDNFKDSILKLAELKYTLSEQ